MYFASVSVSTSGHHCFPVSSNTPRWLSLFFVLSIRQDQSNRRVFQACAQPQKLVVATPVTPLAPCELCQELLDRCHKLVRVCHRVPTTTLHSPRLYIVRPLPVCQSTEYGSGAREAHGILTRREAANVPIGVITSSRYAIAYSNVNRLGRRLFRIRRLRVLMGEINRWIPSQSPGQIRM